MREAQFSSSLTSIYAFCSKLRFQDQVNECVKFYTIVDPVSMLVFINYLVARCRKQCSSTPRAFSHSFCPQNISVELKIIAIFCEFDFFTDK